ncbi:MAG: gas vesicle protein GvpN [Anaerocolumna sp.]
MNDSKILDIGTKDNFVVTNYIRNMTDRSILYLNNGFPVHLRGPAGVGKTALAIHIAKKIGRPILLICGSEEINNENLIGGYYGIRKSFLEDNFITTVYKKEESIKKSWSDGRLLKACKEGYTVIYDEFTRTPPEVNNVLLTILEEKIVDIPYGNSNTFIKLDPEFRIIFTSNPEEYVGVYKSPNALTDRMITMDMGLLDEETEKSIIMTKSRINSEDAVKIMKLSKAIKNKINNTDYVSIRSGIMLAKIVHSAKIKMTPSSAVFRQICKDIYNPINISIGLTDEKRSELDMIIDGAIDFIFANNLIEG